MNIKEVSKDEAAKIFETLEPKGLFYVVEDGFYTGIDNSKGLAWADDFYDLEKCKRWLRGEIEFGDVEYECIKKMSVPKCDGDGFETDGIFHVDKGTVWRKDNDNYRITGAEIRLEDCEGKWVEMSEKAFKEHFRLVKESEVE